MKTHYAYYPNQDDFVHNFWNHNYTVLVTAQGIRFVVNADNEQDAIYYIIDYCQEHLTGLVFTPDEAHNLRLESIKDYGDERYIDDYICFCETYEQEQLFIQQLGKELSTYKLNINL